MITEIRVPKIGMTEDEITVVNWLKKDDDIINKGDEIVVIETAKVTYTMEAPSYGILHILKKVKEKVKVGDVLGILADSKEEIDEYVSSLSIPKEAAISFFEEEGEEGIRLSFENEEVRKGVPLQDLSDRKILKRIPFIGMRKTIANHLVSSLHTGAQLTIISEVDMTELSEFRKEWLLDKPEAKVTFVDIFVKLLASILPEYPIINSSIIGDEIICWGEYNIGVAVSVQDGLVVPIVRNADQKDLLTISREIKSLAERARSNKLSPEDYRGGTFTLSSGGKVDVDFVTPIINSPENAILAIGKIAPKPAVFQGKLDIRLMTHLCLTHDHRAIDGLPASLFISRLKQVIEDPNLFSEILK
ncbi:MAG: dihydrolipoamide acetyltransferase family protein [Candidatus Methanomethylicaceae archaeon]